MTASPRAERNRTIVLSPQERQQYLSRLRRLDAPTSLSALKNSTIHQDIFTVLPLLEEPSIDLLFIDPPYNITKSFNGRVFKQKDLDDYAAWFDSLLKSCVRLLKPTASIYICGDWRSSKDIRRAFFGKEILYYQS